LRFGAVTVGALAGPGQGCRALWRLTIPAVACRAAEATQGDQRADLGILEPEQR